MKKSRRLRRKYGIGIADFNAMRSRQGGACAICGAITDLVVDHCHATRRVRGLLCHNCNVGIGWLRDDPEVMRRAALYVSR